MCSKNIRIAGDKLNDDIISYIRNEFKILIGEKTAENLKIAVGSVVEAGAHLEEVVRGRDLVTGLPREVIITGTDIREAIAHSVESLVEAVREVLEMTPPEVLADVMQRGVYLVGGGALISGMADLLRETLNIPVHVAEDPLTAVARGTGVILEDFDALATVLIANDDDLSPVA